MGEERALRERGGRQLANGGGSNWTVFPVGAYAWSMRCGTLAISQSNIFFGSGLDLGIYGSLQFKDSAPGKIYVDEISLESASDLNAWQQDTFTLASFTFTGLAVGY